MYKVFKSDTEPGWFGIEDDKGAILYESDNFDDRTEAQKFADAHNNGARSYGEAHAQIYGLECFEAG